MIAGKLASIIYSKLSCWPPVRIACLPSGMLSGKHVGLLEFCLAGLLTGRCVCKRDVMLTS
jgi:hypothetical protein